MTECTKLREKERESERDFSRLSEGIFRIYIWLRKTKMKREREGASNLQSIGLAGLHQH
jgi:hypothetical protein